MFDDGGSASRSDKFCSVSGKKDSSILIELQNEYKKLIIKPFPHNN